MIRNTESEAASALFPAKQRLVGTVAAAWGATAAEHALVRISRADTGEEVGPLLEALARTILAEAEMRFGAEPDLAEVWREAAHEAACARFEAVEFRPASPGGRMRPDATVQAPAQPLGECP